MPNWFNIPVPLCLCSTHGVTEKASAREELILFQACRLPGDKRPGARLKSDGKLRLRPIQRASGYASRKSFVVSKQGARTVNRHRWDR